MKYDSEPDTIKHIRRVMQLLSLFRENLERRGREHDKSKLRAPEKPLFDKFTPKLRDTTYGSEEYKQNMKGLQEALDHHYAHNSHHPEHHTNGVNGMTLMDLVEMFCDWKAASERHSDGDIKESIKINEQRFGISPQISDIFRNTAKKLFE